MATAKKTEAKQKDDNERTKAEDIEKIVVDLAKKGSTPSQIGIVLRDKYNVPKIKLLGKKIAQILKENNVEYKTDLDTINKKIKKIETHYGKNRQDKRAEREIIRFIGLRKKLERYKAKRPMSR